MTSFTCTLKATLVAFALLMGSTAAVSRKEIAEAEQERILLEEDENFWGRDLQMSMPPPCIDYKLNFEKYPLIDANGNIVEGNDVDAGDYISDQYQQAFGLDMSSTGGLLPYPRVFDSANPNPKDLDLGTPNGDFGGPGRGEGGRAGTPGANAEPLGNILIIQENDPAEIGDDTDNPNDKRGGGTIDFEWADPVSYIQDVGIIDIETWDGVSSVDVWYYTEIGGPEQYQKIIMDGTGNNGVLTVDVNLPNVKRLRVVFETSGGITFVNFCADTISSGGNGNGGASIPSVAESNVEFGASVAATTTASSSSKGSKSSKRRKLKDEPKTLDSTKEAKGRKLDSTHHHTTKKHKTARRYTRGAQDKKKKVSK